jgi:hypothetical protein
MSVINAAVEAVISWVNTLGLFATVTRGALPTGDGITCEVGPSRPDAVYLDKGLYIPVDLVFNGKHSDLQTVTDAMNQIHGFLTMARTYPKGRGWEITDITTYTLPEVIGREDNGQWLLASSLAMKLSWEANSI